MGSANFAGAQTSADSIVSRVTKLSNQQRWQEIVTLVAAVPHPSAELDFYYGTALARLVRWDDAQRAFLAGAQLQPCETLPRVLKASIRADDIRCNSALLLTSYPAKRHISFRLDDVTYVSNVVQTRLDAKPTLVPATTR